MGIELIQCLADHTALLPEIEKVRPELVAVARHRHAAQLLALIVCVADDYLGWPRRTGARNSISRFFRIAAALPLELQGRLVTVTIGARCPAFLDDAWARWALGFEKK